MEHSHYFPLMSHTKEPQLTSWTTTPGGLPKAPNTIQSSAQKIPPEVLGIIFQYACPPLEFSQSFHNCTRTSLRQSRQHFSFATVSSTWRYAVYATPQLWTSVVLTRDDAQLLELYVTGSRFLHLALELRNPLSRLASQPLGGGRILSQVTSKLKSLILVNLGDDTLDYLSTLEFPVLEKIGILSKGYRVLSRLTVTSTPVLQYLSLHTLPYFNTFHFELPWLSITSLHFDCVPISICVQALSECHNLIEFHCREAYRTQDVENYTPQKPLTLPYLNLFQWPPCNIIIVHDLFRNLRMPVLQSLELGYENRIHAGWDILFRRLPQTLQKLQFYSFHARVEEDIQYPACLIEHTPFLQELILDQCSRPFIDDVFAALSLYDSFTGDPVYLPDLRTLVVINFFPPLDANVPDVTREMVEKRFAGRKELPTFSVSTEAKGGAPEENQRMILVIGD